MKQNVLMHKLAALAGELEALNREGEKYAEELAAATSPALAGLCGRLEEMLHAATHETASELGFILADIAALDRFIRFRARHGRLNDRQLRGIIDTDTVALPLKDELRLIYADATAMLAAVTAIRREWSEAFPAKTYAKTAEAFSGGTEE